MASVQGAVRREVLRGIRAPRFLVLGVFLPLAVYGLYTVTGIGRPADESIVGIAWPAWLMVSMAAFGAMSAATVMAAGSSRSTRAETSGPRTTIVRIAAATVATVLPLLLLPLAGALDGVRLPVGEWAALVAVLWLGALPFVALGALLRPWLDADTGTVVLGAILVVIAILGGLFQPIETSPAALVVVAHLMPSYHLADLGWTVIAGRTGDPLDVLVLAGYLLGIGAIVVWRYWIEGRRDGV
jgi:ABC-2 type transport system permease protein